MTTTVLAIGGVIIVYAIIIWVSVRTKEHRYGDESCDCRDCRDPRNIP